MSLTLVLCIIWPHMVRTSDQDFSYRLTGWLCSDCAIYYKHPKEAETARNWEAAKDVKEDSRTHTRTYTHTTYTCMYTHAHTLTHACTHSLSHKHTLKPHTHANYVPACIITVFTGTLICPIVFNCSGQFVQYLRKAKLAFFFRVELLTFYRQRAKQKTDCSSSSVGRLSVVPSIEERSEDDDVSMQPICAQREPRLGELANP